MKFIDETQRQLNKFIWKYKSSKVKHSVMISDNMGLRTMDVEILSLAWINRIFTSSDWADVVNLYFGKVGGLKYLLRCYYSVELLPYI